MADENTTQTAAAARATKASFRQRYNDTERQRLAMLDRLNRLGHHGRAHPSFRRAMTLLTRTFRNAKLVQRAAILQAADWLISLIEIGTPFL